MHRHLEGEGRLEDDEHRAEVSEQATTALRNQILLDTLAEQLEIKVSQNELLDYLVNASRQYGMDPNTFIQTIDQQGQIPTMVAEVARSKALAVALRRVAVTDTAGNAVDLSEFIGSDAEDAAEAAGTAEPATPRATSRCSTTPRPSRTPRPDRDTPPKAPHRRPVRGLRRPRRGAAARALPTAKTTRCRDMARAVARVRVTASHGSLPGEDRAVQDRRDRQTRSLRERASAGDGPGRVPGVRPQ